GAGGCRGEFPAGCGGRGDRPGGGIAGGPCRDRARTAGGWRRLGQLAPAAGADCAGGGPWAGPASAPAGILPGQRRHDRRAGSSAAGGSGSGRSVAVREPRERLMNLTQRRKGAKKKKKKKKTKTKTKKRKTRREE